jgi:N-acetylglucosamine-6-phosphate deacetylase
MADSATAALPDSGVVVASRVAFGDGGVSSSPAWVAVERGRVVATGTGDPPPTGHLVDGSELVVAPGAIDVQVNGVGPVDFATASVDGLVEAAHGIERDGCTALVPTLVSAPRDAYDAALARVAAARDRAPAILGVHLEGPFLGGAPGAHSPELLGPVDVPWLLDLCDRFGDLVRIVTLAPEADPGLRATAALAARGVIVALGHSTATYDHARAAADAGARLVTHLFNGMGPWHHRAPGLAGAALDDRRLVPSFIADLVHVHPAALRVALTVRPDAVLVTDRVGGDLPVVDGAARLADGTLAGSVVGMWESAANLVAHGVPLGLAVRTATANPARLLQLDDRGRIAPGARADLVALDPATLSPRAVWSGSTPAAPPAAPPGSP